MGVWILIFFNVLYVENAVFVIEPTLTTRWPTKNYSVAATLSDKENTTWLTLSMFFSHVNLTEHSPLQRIVTLRFNAMSSPKCRWLSDVVGAIEPIEPLKKCRSSVYQVNPKGWHSRNIRLICDAKFNLLERSSLWPGSVQDKPTQWPRFLLL